MRVGFTTFAFAWSIGVPGHRPARPMTPTEVLRRVHELGGQVLQVCDNQPLTRLGPDELEPYAALASDLGIAIEPGTRGVRGHDLERCLSLARRFGSKLVRLVVDANGHEPSPAEVAKLLRPRLSAFADASVKLAIENHDRFSASQLAAMVSELGTERVGVALDTVNSFGALEGPEVVMDTLIPHTLTVHLKDFAIYRVESNMGFMITGTPLGAGRLNVPSILRRLKDGGRDVNVLIELWPPRLESIEDTVRQEQEWAAQSARYLTGVLVEQTEAKSNG
jgi:sugar phosphate isomerase/epimerase